MFMNDPRISIIVPCYNGEKFLRETLDCLQKQTIEDWECVIVNDGSTDGSLDIIKEYAANDPRYTYIDKHNEGPSIARNAGIAASAGKYILPFDADDLIAPSYAEKAINYLEEHSDCKLVYCKCDYFGDTNGPFELRSYNYYDLPYLNTIFCSCVYRRSDFDKTSGYNPNMASRHEDWDFLLSLLNEHDKVYCIPETLFFYRQHGNTRNKETVEMMAVTNLQMVINHPEIYLIDKERTVGWINPLTNYVVVEIEKLLNSKSYKLGYLILTPFRWIKGILS